MQLVWRCDDAVFALRRGGDVDPDSWQVRPNERVFRLWTRGALTLALRAAGLSGPEERAGGGLLIARREGSETPSEP